MIYQAVHGIALTTEQIRQLGDREWISRHARHVHKDKVNIVAEIDLTIDGNTRAVVIKHFGWRNTLSRLLSPLMRSRAKKSWDASHWLLTHGVGVPRPLAACTLRRWGFIVVNFLITEKIADYTAARKKLRQPETSIQERSAIIRHMAQMVRKIHQARLIHNDLTLGNFLVANAQPDNIVLIDLNRLKRKLHLSRRARMQDLARMNVCQCHLDAEHAACGWDLLLRAYDEIEVAANRKALRRAIQKRSRRKMVKGFLSGKKTV